MGWQFRSTIFSGNSGVPPMYQKLTFWQKVQKTYLAIEIERLFRENSFMAHSTENDEANPASHHLSKSGKQKWNNGQKTRFLVKKLHFSKKLIFLITSVYKKN